MKIEISLKDPDGIYESIRDAIENSLPDGLSEDEREVLIEKRNENLNLSKWIEYGDYVKIEIDTDENTAEVIPFK